MLYHSGNLTVPKSGLYYVYAQVHCSPRQGGYCGYNINVNMAKTQEHHFEIGYGYVAVGSLTSESGLLIKLEAGDRLSVTARVSSSFRTSARFYMNFQSYFGAVSLS